jgi:hypothetical protein
MSPDRCQTDSTDYDLPSKVQVRGIMYRRVSGEQKEPIVDASVLATNISSQLTLDSTPEPPPPCSRPLFQAQGTDGGCREDQLR